MFSHVNPTLRVPTPVWPLSVVIPLRPVSTAAAQGWHPSFSDAQIPSNAVQLDPPSVWNISPRPDSWPRESRVRAVAVSLFVPVLTAITNIGPQNVTWPGMESSDCTPTSAPRRGVGERERTEASSLNSYPEVGSFQSSFEHYFLKLIQHILCPGFKDVHLSSNLVPAQQI